MLDWRTVSEADFNRVAESLIRRSVEADDPGLEVRALDGRGGDGGIDVDVRARKTQQLIAIYQLKWFPEGFSGGFAKSRKPQIRKSFEAALQHEPEVWYLVVPRNLTPKERTFVRSLQGKHRKPRVSYLGAGELDDLLQRFPHVDEWAQRNPTRTALKEVGRESAALVKPGDLHSEISNIAEKLSARSDYWDWNFSRQGGTQLYSLVPKREDASDREPLSINITTTFTGAPELATAYKSALDYGPTEPVRVPGEYVTHFERVGPEWWAEVSTPHVFEIHPSPRKIDTTSRLVLRDADGRIIAQRTARSVHATSGARGGNLILDLGDGIQVTMRLEKDHPESGSMQFNMSLEGQTGSVALRALEFQRAFSEVKTLEHHLGKGVSIIDVPVPGEPPNPAYVEFAEDLAVIERELGVALLIPVALPSTLDRINARVARRILSGEVTLVPQIDGLTITLDGEYDETVEQVMTTDGVLSITEPGWDVEILNQTITLPNVGLLFINVRAIDGKEHIAAWKSGHGAPGRIVKLAPSGIATGLRAYGVDRVDPQQPLVPLPWKLTGILEHKELRSLEAEPAHTD